MTRHKENLTSERLEGQTIAGADGMNNGEKLIDVLLISLSDARRALGLEVAERRHRRPDLPVFWDLEVPGRVEPSVVIAAYLEERVEDVATIWWLRIVREGHRWVARRTIERIEHQVETEDELDALMYTDSSELARELPALVSEFFRSV